MTDDRQHSCMYNVAWLQSKPPGSQYPLPQMSVFASRDIKKGEVLYAYYNDAYCTSTPVSLH